MDSERTSITIFAPASISNVGPGFDILGFAIEGMGDTITLTRRADSEYVIESVGANLPLDPEENVATVALKSFCNAIGHTGGFDIRIEKNFKPGSGLGSSASSAVGTVFAANTLLECNLPKKDLIQYALNGEAIASGNKHADNIAPCMLGGLVAVKSADPFDGFQIPFPADLKILIIFPDIPIKTAEARAILPKEVSMEQGIAQASNMAGLVKGLMSADYDQIRSSLKDQFAQPYRKALIPSYDEVEDLVHGAGAFGFNISGSGPTMFAFFKKSDDLDALKTSVEKCYRAQSINVQFHETSVNQRGVELI